MVKDGECCTVIHLAMPTFYGSSGSKEQTVLLIVTDLSVLNVMLLFLILFPIFLGGKT